ncbi:ABC transporter permease [Streptomyces mobaraensis NBRC 13819 = DSM 40847]|uniref:ABC transporter system integral membrane protein n=1 Tax=Streptomyces mobaraensis (strain ATCC 29032 / DSM 40847 / JCM 4168 / NBRC 13819 / NCIMB 11159 / IPCR 16-22) TaxID=1223523 RepID=M3ABH1_STRM1|nr:ABC transporter permease [Streptomyces mobaraensis]EMF02539.1 ABC transporter system integral membrane protein [Streptomyces mobaraensis NBRC 13819 = DSM 40847]QTT75580.1 ABC transporter permease [Streptomyces mobaraensis NBRC 13819 = DSM 40847]
MTELLTAAAPPGATAPGDPARTVTGARRVWRRLRAHRAALPAAAVLALLVLLALAAPLLAALEGQDATTYHDGLVDSARGGVPLGPFGGISADHWLGVEPGTGRDLFVRLLYGARVSLAVAVGATLVQVLVGVAVGLAAALGNRVVDGILGHLTDVMVALPMLVFAIALTAVVPAGFPRPALLVLVIGLIAWGGLARVVRAQALALKKFDHVAAARLTGASEWRIARRELLPALAAPVITYAAILLPANMIMEAGMSFLGVGITPPTPSWGQMLSAAQTWFRTDPLYVVLPALMLFVTTFAFTVLGDALRGALDPRQASRLRVGRRGRAARTGSGTGSGTGSQADVRTGGAA